MNSAKERIRANNIRISQYKLDLDGADAAINQLIQRKKYIESEIAYFEARNEEIRKQEEPEL